MIDSIILVFVIIILVAILAQTFIMCYKFYDTYIKPKLELKRQKNQQLLEQYKAQQIQPQEPLDNNTQTNIESSQNMEQ